MKVIITMGKVKRNGVHNADTRQHLYISIYIVV